MKGLTESNKLKIKETTNLKAIAQMILDQRSDIENFFLESLEQVKEEKRRKLQSESDAQKAKNPKKPGLLKFVDGKQVKEGSDERITVEMSDLDWEDRERILRLLFSKMNTGENASNWRDPTEPS